MFLSFCFLNAGAREQLLYVPDAKIPHYVRLGPHSVSQNKAFLKLILFLFQKKRGGLFLFKALIKILTYSESYNSVIVFSQNSGRKTYV